MSRSDELAELVRADRLEEAAALAERLSLPDEAARLWEQACRFREAARCRLAAADPATALVLAARAEAGDVERAALEALERMPDRARDAALRLEAAGLFAAAGRALLAAGDPIGAARRFERACLFGAAADAFERAGARLEAARCLERALSASPGDAQARLRLGRLLLQAGRLEHAVRALQPMAANVPGRREALALLAAAFQELGMPEAAREVERERGTGDETPAPPAPLPRVATSASEGEGQVLFGRYAVARLVAVTPTARVYQAFDRVSSRVVAVKLFSAAAVRDAGRDALRRFEREALALGRLRHPTIVALVDYVADGPALVLEWMDGGSLANVLAAGPIAPARAAEIARALLAALAEAHRRGILHRDVKPSNVLFDAAGAARLSDFGVAHVGERAATVTAGILGTLAYMAPEQRAGAAATTQTDVYGVGALLWHCLTGGPPAARLPPLADDLPPETYAAAADLIAVAAERPADALSARALLARVPWPAEVPTRRPRSLPPPASRPETTARLEPRGDGVFFDELLGRLVQIAAARPERVARARAFARADHPALAAVLALDEAADRVIVEVIEGDAAEPPFTPAELAELAGALGALHRAGGAHGRIDRKHLVRRGGRLVLRFPMDAGAAAEADDLRALDELRRRSSAP